jgi:tetratricopeptide (TPR) repeat protein
MARVAAAMILAASLGAVRQSVDPRLIPVEAAYRSVAVHYRAGRVEAALAGLRAIKRDDLRLVVDGLKAREVARFAWERPYLVAAAMAHLDQAIEDIHAGRQPSFAYHADLAAGVLAAADIAVDGTTEPAASPTARRASLALGLLLLGEGRLTWARAHLDAATIAFPADAQLRLALGTVEESSASGWVPPGRFTKTTLAAARAVRDQWLRNAAHEFETALQIAPSLVEARIRLAHVHILQHEDAAALDILNEALAVARDPRLVYIARLFAGGIREREGRMESAIGQYLAAAGVVPDGQSAYIALSHALQATRDGASAARALERLFSRPRVTNGGDPWWGYPHGHWSEATAILEALRVEARQ